jgi:hypothetical protein
MTPEEPEPWDDVDERIRSAFAAVSLDEQRMATVCPPPSPPSPRWTPAGWALAATTLLTLTLVGGGAVAPWFASGGGRVVPAETAGTWTFEADPLDRVFEAGERVQVYSTDPLLARDHGVQRVAAVQDGQVTLELVDPEGWGETPAPPVRLARLDGPLRVLRMQHGYDRGMSYILADERIAPIEVLESDGSTSTVRFERDVGMYLAAYGSTADPAAADPDIPKADFSRLTLDVAACWTNADALRLYDAQTGMALGGVRARGRSSLDGCLADLDGWSWVDLGARTLVTAGSVDPDDLASDPLILSVAGDAVEAGTRVGLWSVTPDGHERIAVGMVRRTVADGALAHVIVPRLDAPRVIRAGRVVARPLP